MQKALDFEPAAPADGARFHPAVEGWLSARFGAATEVQARAWQVIANRQHALIAAPTGSGKTLAAFLSAINDLVVASLRAPLADEVQVLYVSPLKALSNDIEKNLQEPLAGIRERLLNTGHADPGIRAAVRTGDTPVFARASMRRTPPQILVTTPESLFILLTSDSGRRMLASVKSVIVDELHAVAGSKRGAHLMLSLARLDALCTQSSLGPPVRIGLSATVKPLEEMARFLTGELFRSPLPPAGEGLGERARAVARGSAAPTPDAVRPPFPHAAEGSCCAIIDAGHVRERDLAIEMPRSPLTAVMATEVWGELYDRLAELIRQHRTTLIFVNQRRVAERAARHLVERLGEEHVTAHHGSLAKEHRLKAEQRLKAGELKALVATSSLELGIDIGDIDLVCQLGSPRAINAFLQRVGRAGHQIGAIPKGRLFPLSLDDLLEGAALLDAIARGELDRIRAPVAPLDVLAQQIVAEAGCREWIVDELYACFRSAAPYRELKLADFEQVVQMLADGYATRRGRRGAYLHYDAVNRVLRGRRGARLTAVTNAGVIPDQFDYEVVLLPEAHRVGTLNEDFAFESLPGDIFQLGNASYRVAKVEVGKVFVEDAKGQPPTMPFWLGEGLGRTDELSAAVSRLGEHAESILRAGLPERSPLPHAGEGSCFASTARDDSERPAKDGRAGRPDNRFSLAMDGCDETYKGQGEGREPSERNDGALPDCERWLADDIGLPQAGAKALALYLATSYAAFGALPSASTIIFERFFDEVGDTHLVIHSPYGSRLNKAWGLALRKRFCRQFNFELQASALDDSIVLSLGPSHSFPLEDVKHFLKSSNVREVLTQALLDAPMFGTRWRWNATTALAIRRMNGGKRVPPQFQRSDSEDLLTVVFPDQVACAENLLGEREIPDHPLVRQTIADCLHETTDIEGLECLLKRIEEGSVRVLACDLAAPSPMSGAILSAKPYAFLDDGAAEERRTRAVAMQPLADLEAAANLGQLDPEAIARVREEARPDPANADELHDALVVFGFLTGEEVAGYEAWLHELTTQRRITALRVAAAESRLSPGVALSLVDAQRSEGLDSRLRRNDEVERKPVLWIAAERLHEWLAVLPRAELSPPIAAVSTQTPSPDVALRELVRSRLELLGPVSDAEFLAPLPISAEAVRAALLQLEAEGTAMRLAGGDWCERRLLARIHRYSRERRRAEIRPVSPAQFLRFLFRWHGLASGESDARRQGEEALLASLRQLEGCPASAAAWESDLLPARIRDYQPYLLDKLCAAGRIVWTRPPATANGEESKRRAGPIRSTPILLCEREALAHWQAANEANAVDAQTSPRAEKVLAALRTHGASFFSDLVHDSGLLRGELEDALGELVSLGQVTCDSFAGLRALVTPAERRRRLARFGARGLSIDDAGRWSLTARPRRVPEVAGALAAPHVEHIARVLLRRYGVVFRKLLEREDGLPPWRDLFYVYRRLEARGEIRGGRFVSGFSGEQFALPEAAAALRKQNAAIEVPTLASVERVLVSAADPLNLVGVLTPGEKLPRLPGNRVLFENGVPVALHTGGEVRYLVAMEPQAEWETRNLLIRRQRPGSYLEPPARPQ